MQQDHPSFQAVPTCGRQRLVFHNRPKLSPHGLPPWKLSSNGGLSRRQTVAHHDDSHGMFPGTSIHHLAERDEYKPRPGVQR